MFSIIFGQDAGKWKGYNYENKTATPIIKQDQLRTELHSVKLTKPSGYKSINSSSLKINNY
jgi:hypothetical protein